MPRLKMKMSKGFTIINNSILRDSTIGSSPRGIYVTMLSMADGWNFTVRGLAKIMGEGVTKTSNALHVLEEKHYLKRVRVYENGRIIDWDYYLYDEPYPFDGSDGNAESLDCSPSQDTGEQDTDELDTENLNQHMEKQYDYKRTRIEKPKEEVSSAGSSIDQSASDGGQAAEKQMDRSMDGYAEEQRIYTEVVKANIDYADYAEWISLFGNSYMTIEELDDIVGMIVRAIVSRKPTERICGQDFPREVIRSAMLRVDRTCIENAIEIMKQTDDIRNYERYLISTLFNEAHGRHFKEQAVNRNIDYAVRRDFGGV